MDDEKDKTDSQSDNIYWSSPAYPHRRKTAFELQKAGLKLAVVCLVLIVFKLFIAAAALAGFAFLIYIISSVEPEKVKHVISGNGITTGGETYVWEDLSNFYFTKIYGREVMYVETEGDRPTKLIMIIHPNDREHIQNVMEEFIPFKGDKTLSSLERGLETISRWFSLD